jgi:plastocyanin
MGQRQRAQWVQNSIRLVLCPVLGWSLLSQGVAMAQPPPSAAEFARLQAEVTRLQRDVEDQKKLILRVMQSEQQRYDILLQLIGSNSGSAASARPSTLPAPDLGGVAPVAETVVVSGDSPKADGPKTASVSGRVTLPPGVSVAYVYVDGLRGGKRSQTVEIRQKDKRFLPEVVAVPVGTQVVFPNGDAIYHNVFSTTRGSAFDLGSMKGGDTSRPVTLSRPGHVEVFCNIHSKMRADVLVVPSGHFAKVASDGSFNIEGVPTGTRKVILWAPGVAPVTQRVDVSGRGATVEFTGEKRASKPHLNKFGQAYGSYED